MTDWESVRQGFSLRGNQTHLAALVMSSHSRWLNGAIKLQRDEFDRDPVTHLHKVAASEMTRFNTQAGRYFGVTPDHVAQCGSTTQGLGYIYSGIRLQPHERILTTAQEFPATLEPLKARQRRQGTPLDVLPQLFGNTPDPSGMVTRLRNAITRETRLLAITWVYSSRGVKSPIRAITDMVRELNLNRTADDRILVAVDGVHGFGIENVTFDELGCDFFVSGTHKWIYGPRGTGVMYAKPDAWALIEPIVWTSMPHTANGVHAYEHDFSVADAFDWLWSLDKAAIEARVRALTTQLKDGLVLIPGVELVTPHDESLSSGIVCFDLRAKGSATTIVAELAKRNVIATESASDVVAGFKHVRLSPSIINNDADITIALDAIENIARS